MRKPINVDKTGRVIFVNLPKFLAWKDYSDHS